MCYLLVLTGAIPARSQSALVRYDIVPSQSTVNWTGYYLFNFGEHFGTVDVSDGSLSVNHQDALTGALTIDMRSVKVLDLPFNDGGGDLATHLMSDDFFDAGKFPHARLEIISSEPIDNPSPGAANTKVFANLTIKSTTAPITFDALLERTATALKAQGKFKFDRTRWGVEYNSGKIFSQVGDGAISDAIAIAFSLNAEIK